METLANVSASAVVLSLILASSATHAQSSPGAPSLPEGAKFLSQKEVFKRYGKTAKEAIKRDRQIAIRAKKQGLEFFEGTEENEAIRLRDGREILIMAGRSAGNCGGFPTAIGYEAKKKNIAILSYGWETRDVPSVPIAGGFDYRNRTLLPKDEFFAILWKAIERVQPVQEDLPGACFEMEEDKELGLE